MMIEAVTIGPIPSCSSDPEAPAIMVLYWANKSRDSDWSRPYRYTLVMMKYRTSMTITHIILVLKCTCPSGRLTEGSLSAKGLILYNRLGVSSIPIYLSFLLSLDN